jgi:hypothetical protein
LDSKGDRGSTRPSIDPELEGVVAT